MIACSLCNRSGEHASDLGPLLGPLKGITGPGGESCWVHSLCALWSPEVYQTEHGVLKHVRAAVRRGRLIKCSSCGLRGATAGCRVERCSCCYHLPCARRAGCFFNTQTYHVACPSHKKLFKQEQAALAAQKQGHPQAPTPRGGPAFTWGSHRTAGRGRASPGRTHQLPPTTSRGGASPPRKRARHTLEARHAHLQDAARALLRPQGSLPGAGGAVVEDADEAEWVYKERRRAWKNTARLEPIILAGAGGGPEAVRKARLLCGANANAYDGLAAPLRVWGSEAPGFESLGGLQDVVSSLTEMALVPLLYPGLLGSLGIQPPRGLLLQGVPGTGKTAAVRALAGECARRAPGPVALYVRKGADCLGKYVGDAERTLRLLFEDARRRAPAIIFLDELDALAPARSVRESTADQVHASVVSTLLSLMDGVSDRGQVLVIGATNRPDTLDPALRRPGRFDREVYFGLPSAEARADILSRLTRDWQPCPPPADLISRVSAAAEGFAGADLQALACAAVVAAAKRAAKEHEVAVAKQQLQQQQAGLASQGNTVMHAGGDPQAARPAAPPASPPHPPSSHSDRHMGPEVTKDVATADDHRSQEEPQAEAAAKATRFLSAFHTFGQHLRSTAPVLYGEGPAQAAGAQVPATQPSPANANAGSEQQPQLVMNEAMAADAVATCTVGAHTCKAQQQDKGQEAGAQGADQGGAACQEQAAGQQVGLSGGVQESCPEWARGMTVTEEDWWAALAAAPPPAALRDPSLARGPRRRGERGGPGAGIAPLPYALAPLLLPWVRDAVVQAATKGLLPGRVPPALKRAYTAAVACEASYTEPPPSSAQPASLLHLEHVLVELGAAEDGPGVSQGATAGLASSAAHPASSSKGAEVQPELGSAGGPAGGTLSASSLRCAGRGTVRHMASAAPGAGSGVPGRLLLCGGCHGEGEVVAATLVSLLGGDVQVVTLALPSLVQMGEGDPVVGMTRALGEATARAPQSWAGSQGQRAGGPATATLLYLPHMELWALSGEVHATAEEGADTPDQMTAGPRPCTSPTDTPLPQARPTPGAASAGEQATGIKRGPAVPAAPHTLATQSPFLPADLSAATPSVFKMLPHSHSNVVPAQQHSLLPLASPTPASLASARTLKGGAHKPPHAVPTQGPHLAQAQQVWGPSLHPEQKGRAEQEAEAGSMAGEERAALTPLWAVLEECCRQAAATGKPLSILGSCALPAEALPLQLLSFFGWEEREEGEEGRGAAGTPVAAAAGGGVVCAPDRDPTSSSSFWEQPGAQQSLQRSAHQVATCVLLPHLAAAAVRAGPLAVPPSQASAGHNGPHPISLGGDMSSDVLRLLEQHQQPLPTEGDERQPAPSSPHLVSDPSSYQGGLSQAEWEEAQQLEAQEKAAVRAMAANLYNDPRSGLLTAILTRPTPRAPGTSPPHTPAPHQGPGLTAAAARRYSGIWSQLHRALRAEAAAKQREAAARAAASGGTLQVGRPATAGPRIPQVPEQVRSLTELQVTLRDVARLALTQGALPTLDDWEAGVMALTAAVVAARTGGQGAAGTGLSAAPAVLTAAGATTPNTGAPPAIERGVDTAACERLGPAPPAAPAARYSATAAAAAALQDDIQARCAHDRAALGLGQPRQAKLLSLLRSSLSSKPGGLLTPPAAPPPQHLRTSSHLGAGHVRVAAHPPVQQQQQAAECELLKVEGQQWQAAASGGDADAGQVLRAAPVMSDPWAASSPDPPSSSWVEDALPALTAWAEAALRRAVTSQPVTAHEGATPAVHTPAPIQQGASWEPGCGVPELMGGIRDVVQEGMSRINECFSLHPCTPTHQWHQPGSARQDKVDSSVQEQVARVLQAFQLDIARRLTSQD